MIDQGSYGAAGTNRLARWLAAGIAATLAACALLLVLPATDAAAKRASKHARCADSNLVIQNAKQQPRLERATRCLINHERRRRGLKTLRKNSDLQKSAAWQAGDMLSNEYFDHKRPGGPEFAERVLITGYADDANGYLIGENLAWASAPRATPRKIVAMWMRSRAHRRNLLTRGFRDQGLATRWSPGGVGGDYAKSGGPFVIFVSQFGRRY